MNVNVLKERIQQQLRSLSIGTGVTDADVEITTDAGGIPDVTVNTTTGEIKMDDGLSNVIATAVATGLRF